MLNFWGLAGYRVSQKKAQVAQRVVTILGSEKSKGERKLGTEHKEAMCQFSPPQSKRELRGFLG